MITKCERSWQLFKVSIRVILRHRKLLCFPLLTTLLTGFIILFFLSATALPMVLQQTGYRLNQKQHWVALKDKYFPNPAPQTQAAQAPAGPNVLITGHSVVEDRAGHPFAAHGFPWDSLVLLAIYFVSMFLATFFNVAFYSEIIAAVNGNGVSFRRGLMTARSRLPSILAWSLLAGLVGWIIRSIEQRLPFAARIVTGLIGIGWSIAAVFAIPVIIQERHRRNPIRILQQSAMTLKQTWGEGLIGYIGFSAGSAMIFVGLLLPLLAVGALALQLKSTWLVAIVAGIWFLGMLLLAYLSNLAGHVYRCALYMYAAEGVVPEPYNQDLLDMAWKVKKT